MKVRDVVRLLVSLMLAVCHGWLQVGGRMVLRGRDCARVGLMRMSSTGTGTVTESVGPFSVLSLPLDVLAEKMGGTGKAKSIWESLREGRNPLHDGALSDRARQTLSALHCTATARATVTATATATATATVSIPQNGYSVNEYEQRTKEDTMIFGNELVKETVSACGTRKLLLRLFDELEIETVLIPNSKYDRTTVCVSSQVGCDRACAFCLTGTMGLVRNLSSSEIVGQVVRSIAIAKQSTLPAVRNVVFMGMGDAARNYLAVTEAIESLSDAQRLCFAQSKLTVSTVGPSAADIESLIAHLSSRQCSRATIAWSLHAVDPILRKKLVPSTRESPEVLREALLTALARHRPQRRTRTLMIAIALIDSLNDSEEHAEQLADFLQPMFAVCEKIAIDLIPYNDVGIRSWIRRPSMAAVNAFQSVLTKRGLFCAVRATRGDEQFSACGMLATKTTVSETRRRRANGATALLGTLS